MPIKQHLHFNIPDEVDAKIWRYISFDKLNKLLEDKSLYFSRCDRFDDQHEGSYTAQAKEHRRKFYAEASGSWLNKTMPMINENLKKCTFISCWHVNEHENMHMWQSYTDKKKTIAMTSSIGKIKNYILDNESTFLLGLVNYIDYRDDLISEANSFAPFFCKRKEFAGEREFRIIKECMVDIDKINNREIIMPDGINIPIDVNNCIDQIIISPLADDGFKQKVVCLLKKHNMQNKNCVSSLNSTPIY